MCPICVGADTFSRPTGVRSGLLNRQHVVVIAAKDVQPVTETERKPRSMYGGPTDDDTFGAKLEARLWPRSMASPADRCNLTDRVMPMVGPVEG